MSLNKKQKLILKRCTKAITILFSNQIELREMLYSPFNPTTQRYISSRRDKRNIELILDFIEIGQSRWNEDRLNILVNRYSSLMELAGMKRNANT